MYRQVQGKLLFADGGNPRGSRSTAVVMTFEDVVYFLNSDLNFTLPLQEHVELR